jgi:hypothetical protein
MKADKPLAELIDIAEEFCLLVWRLDKRKLGPPDRRKARLVGLFDRLEPWRRTGLEFPTFDESTDEGRLNWEFVCARDVVSHLFIGISDESVIAMRQVSANLRQILGRLRLSAGEAVDANHLRPVQAWYDESSSSFQLGLAKDSVLDIPWSIHRRLLGASNIELAQMVLTPDSVQWPMLDLEISVTDLRNRGEVFEFSVRHFADDLACLGKGS